VGRRRSLMWLPEPPIAMRGWGPASIVSRSALKRSFSLSQQAGPAASAQLMALLSPGPSPPASRARQPPFFGLLLVASRSCRDASGCYRSGRHDTAGARVLNERRTNHARQPLAGGTFVRSERIRATS